MSLLLLWHLLKTVCGAWHFLETKEGAHPSGGAIWWHFLYVLWDRTVILSAGDSLCVLWVKYSWNAIVCFVGKYSWNLTVCSVGNTAGLIVNSVGYLQEYHCISFGKIQLESHCMLRRKIQLQSHCMFCGKIQLGLTASSVRCLQVSLYIPWEKTADVSLYVVWKYSYVFSVESRREYCVGSTVMFTVATYRSQRYGLVITRSLTSFLALLMSLLEHQRQLFSKVGTSVDTNSYKPTGTSWRHHWKYTLQMSLYYGVTT